MKDDIYAREERPRTRKKRPGQEILSTRFLSSSSSSLIRVFRGSEKYRKACPKDCSRE